MAPRYGPDAVERCLRLYLKFNGQQFTRIEQEMRKVYPGWKRDYLHTRGKGANQRIGWVELYGFEKALAIHLAQKPTATLNSAEQLVSEIDTVRQQLYERVRAQGTNADKDLLQLLRDYMRLSIEALTKVEAARDTLGGWVSFWERLLDWIPDIDLETARRLVRFGDQITAKAEREFGETQQMVESLMNGNKDTAAEGLPGTQA